MKKLALLLITVFFSQLSLYSASQQMTPERALRTLMDGNSRFAQGKLTNKHQDEATRKSLKNDQHPFAVIITCADSRVAPEILFDQGIGDLFVIRVAGNVIGPYELESVTYAVEHLGSSIVLVMGHQDCGAINAVVNSMPEGIPFIAQVIRSSVIKARDSGSKNILRTSTEFNAEAMAQFVRESSPVNKMFKAGTVDVKAAYYDFQKGKVILL